MPEYQVFHQQAVKSFSAGEDNEHQRRWTESQWEAKASNKKFNYDKSRAHLNFEIVKGGKIVPLGSSKPILERFQDRLKGPLVRKTLTKGLKRPNIALPAI
ncbi:plasmid recombination protein [Bacteroides ovatus]|nr:plasmid recombination protein [Bacteroides ovatus]